MAPTLGELQNQADNRGLIRKAIRAVGVIAPLSVELPEKITDPSGLPIDLLTAGFLPVGMVTPDGWNFGRETEKDEIEALGYASFVRSDISSVARSITVTTLETGRRHMLELQYGMDLSTIEQDADGEVVFDEPDMPIGAEYRLLALFDDGPADNNWVLAKGYPRVKLAEVGEETYGKEGAIQRELTFDVFTDDDLGTPCRHYFGGTGALAARDVLGFSEPTP